MSRILIATFGSYGDVDPYLGLAAELRARGHRVTIATSEFFRGYVEAEGHDFRGLRPHVSPADRDVVDRIMDARRGTEYLLREVILPGLRDSYEDLATAMDGHDLLVTHPVTFAGPILAEQRRLLWVSTVLAPISFLSRHDLPIFPPAPWLKGYERSVPGLGAILVAMARRLSSRWAAPIHALRRELGLPRSRDPIFEGQHSPYSVLALFSRAFASPQPDWPPNVVLTGNVFHESAVDLDPNLAAYLDDGPPPIVFTLGSAAVHSAGDFYAESAEAIRRLAKRAVLLIGRDAGVRLPQPLPQGVHTTAYAPFGRLFPRAAAVVHHGGIGTTAHALRAGRPALIVPFSHDQPDNAHRVASLGAGRTLPLSEYRARRVATELTALLGNGSYATAAQSAASRMETERGAATAADEIERQLTLARAE